MVYRGPRRGCQNCKRRKRKCDDEQPTCSGCLKRNEVCERFENALDAVLRDESAKVSEKVQRQQASISRVQSRVQSRATSAIPQSAPDGQVLDAAYFFLNVYGDPSKDPDTSVNFLELIRPVFSSAAADSPIVYTVTAVSVFLQDSLSGHLLESDRARQYLGKALKAVNLALASPRDRSKDENLMAVMLLEIYDMLYNGVQSQATSGTHHKGAIALAEARGSLNYQTETARKLLVALRHSILIDSNRRYMKVDLSSSIWSDDSSPAPMPHNKAIALDQIRLDFVNLKATIHHQLNGDFARLIHGDNEDDLLELATKIKTISQRLSDWYNSVPRHWLPIAVSGSECIPQSVIDLGMYGSTCYVYHDLHVSSVMNSYRVTHVTVLKWLIQLCLFYQNSPSLDYGHWQIEEVIARTSLQSLVDDFCASVPFHLGNKMKAELSDNRPIAYPRLPNNPEANQKNAKQATALGGWFILGSLRGIIYETSPSSSIYPPLLGHQQREWLLNQAARIAAMYNIRTDAETALGKLFINSG